MPHDANGELLNVGDLVDVECKVTQVMAGEEYCNLSLETTRPMFPGEHKTPITVNAKQVVKKPDA